MSEKLGMRKLLFTSLLLVFIWNPLFSQVNECSYKPPKEGETWCFYSNIQLKFQGENVTKSVLPSTLNFGKGCASISDENGNLILYTDGMRLWNNNSFPLSTTLDGDLGATQSSLIVPNPDGLGRYYIFTTDLLYPAPIGTKGLNFSEIDITKISGTDTLKVKRLQDETPEKLTGVKHANGKDYWVLAHGWNNGSFYAYKVTTAGVDSLPVVSSVGQIQTGTLAARNMVGYMKLSPDGKKLAMAVMGAKTIEVFDFDNSTGQVSNAITIASPDIYSPYGVEFSPDCKKLYFSTVNPSTNASNNLYQYDLVSGSAPVLLNKLSKNMTALQLATDGKIYVARYNYAFLGIIQNPNRPDTACNYMEDGYDLNGNKSLLGLPNFIQSYFDVHQVNYDTKCLYDDTQFYLNNTANIDSIVWNFGDPSTGAANSDKRLQPSHIFSAPGDYTIQLIEYYQNRQFSSSYPVKINPLPPKSWSPLPDSIYILPGSAVELDAGELMRYYLWDDGSTEQKLVVSEPGFYNVSIIDTNCCQQNDTIKVLLLDLFVPSAFSPNFDGKNDKFRVKGPTQGIDNYHFYVYNRWGQLLWESDSFDDGWDGTFNGTECPMGVYAWVMKFSVSGNLLNKDKVLKRGVITLVK